MFHTRVPRWTVLRSEVHRREIHDYSMRVTRLFLDHSAMSMSMYKAVAVETWMLSDLNWFRSGIVPKPMPVPNRSCLGVGKMYVNQALRSADDRYGFEVVSA